MNTGEEYVSLEEYVARKNLNRKAVGSALTMLRHLGFDLDSEHTERTPGRIVNYLSYILADDNRFVMTSFANKDPVVDEMVVVPGISFWSACSHHCLPFFGKVSVGYIPDKRLIGLSKIPLLVRCVARGFWMQEHLAQAIADEMEKLEPKGVAVRIVALHTCQLMDCRQPPVPLMKTMVLRGCMKEDESCRDEFVQEIADQGQLFS